MKLQLRNNAKNPHGVTVWADGESVWQVVIPPYGVAMATMDFTPNLELVSDAADSIQFYWINPIEDERERS